MDYEYDAYGDYDVYHDGSYNMGPTYNRDALKTGTVFDAEDHGEPPAPPSNIPTGIIEDTPGGGEFSSPGGGRDIGSRAGASYESVQDDDYGLL